MTKLIRVKRDTFEKLVRLAGKLQMKLKRVVSLDETVNYLLARKGKDVKAFLQKTKNKKIKRPKRIKQVHTEMNKALRREIV